MKNTSLSFGAVICTFNRRLILEQCLHFWHRLERLPDQFIVVDASADAASYRDTLIKQFSRLFAKAENQYIIADRPGLTHQRNIGLQAINTDIVCFADDDAFIEPDYVGKILEVFEADVDGLVGGVNGVSKGQFDTWRQRYYRELRNYARHHFGGFLQRIHIPKHLTQLHSPMPEGLKDMPLINIDRLWGANMNYRTEIVRSLCFDENFQRYGLFEDVDMSVRVGQTHKLVCRLDAQLDHDDTLGQATRPSNVKYFLISWLNSAYIIEKNFDCSESRSAHRHFFDFINFAPSILPQAVCAKKFRTFGNQELRQIAQAHIQAIQACKSRSSLEQTFLRLQDEVFALVKQA